MSLLGRLQLVLGLPLEHDLLAFYVPCAYRNSLKYRTQVQHDLLSDRCIFFRIAVFDDSILLVTWNFTLTKRCTSKRMLGGCEESDLRMPSVLRI